MVNITTDEATREVIREMAAQLQTTATQALELYTTGIQVEAATQLIAIVLAVITTVSTSVRVYREVEKEADEEDAVGSALIVGLAVLFISGIGLDMVADLVVDIILPEYTVIQEVIQTVR